MAATVWLRIVESNFPFAYMANNRDDMRWNDTNSRQFETNQMRWRWREEEKKEMMKKYAGGHCKMNNFRIRSFPKSFPILRIQLWRRPFPRCSHTRHKIIGSIKMFFLHSTKEFNIMVFFFIHPLLCASHPSFKMQF